MFTKTNEGRSQGGASQDSSKRPSRTAPSIISHDMHVNGMMSAAGDIQVDGKVDGDITSGSLTVGEKALIKGEVLAEEVVVRGKVQGSIRARKVQLCASAHVEGDIFHQSLAVETGAYFEGNCRHSDDPLKEKSAKGGAGASRSSESGGRRIGSGSQPSSASRSGETSKPANNDEPATESAAPVAAAPKATPIVGPGPSGASPRVPGGLIGRSGPLHLGRRPTPVGKKGAAK